MEIKAVIMDFGGTLVEGGLEWEPYHQSIRAILKGKGYPHNMKDLKKALRSALDKLNNIRNKGKELTFEEVYASFLTRLGLPSDPETIEELHENYKYYFKSHFFNCTEKVLQKLSSRYKLALLSNTMSNQPHIKLEEAGYDKYFDVIICSRDIGVRKPNPEAFKRVLDMLGVKPENTVHVGDSVEADMYGARESRITGIWIKSSDQPIWNGRAINNICELPSYLAKM
jgi:putative hydrolase of the HAD superfamily